MAFVTTPGAANANSYPTVAEADEYHQGHIYASGWYVLTNAQKETALRMATRVIDVMPGAWSGSASTAIQALGWPRKSMKNRNGFAIPSTSIPYELKDAVAEFARQLSGKDLTKTNDVQMQGVKSVSAGPVAVSFKEPLTFEQQGLPSARALAGMIPDAVQALIVDSWLIPVKTQKAAEMMPPLLEMI
jgi:hypothetical protein